MVHRSWGAVPVAYNGTQKLRCSPCGNSRVRKAEKLGGEAYNGGFGNRGKTTDQAEKPTDKFGRFDELFLIYINLSSVTRLCLTDIFIITWYNNMCEAEVYLHLNNGLWAMVR